MPRFITRGQLTQDYAKGMLAAPEDREPAIRQIVEAVGCKFVALYFTTGDSDFLLITEGEGDDIIAGLMTAAAAGTVSNLSTVRAWTGAEFKAIADKAAGAASAYKAPGQG